MPRDPANSELAEQIRAGDRPSTSEQVEQLILQDLPGRLASALLGLTEKRTLDSESWTIAITQQEISEMVGMTRESINKQLRAWAARNWVRLEHGVIVVLDATSLRELAEAGSNAARVPHIADEHPGTTNLIAESQQHDEELATLRDLLLRTITDKLGAPADHLAYIRNELRAVRHVGP